MAAKELVVAARRLREGVSVVSVAGELDLVAAPRFTDALLATIAAGAKSVIVDLTESTFVDSSALAALVHASKRLRPRRGSVGLVCGESRSVRVLELTGLTRVFPVYGTVAEAAAALPPAPPAA